MRSDKIEELMDIYETLVDAGVTFYYEDEENDDATVGIEPGYGHVCRPCLCCG